ELELPDEHNKDPNDGENVLDIETDIIGENDDESDSDDNVEESQIQDQLDQCIDHPVENSNAKWDLKIMFKDNLHCPF
ncbi:15852_t:CDS:2, partial [Funneliformis mosseae]